MRTLLKQFFSRLRERRRGELRGKPLIDREAVEEMLERSRVPAVLMLVLVWTVSSVLLILSRERQYHLLDWIEGQRAPFSIYAAVDFQYADSAATARKRDEARQSIPDYYREDGTRITDDVNAFFTRLAVRVDRQAAVPPAADPGASADPAKSAKPAAPAKSAKPAEPAAPATEAATLADRTAQNSPALAKALDDAYRRKGNARQFDDYLQLMLKRGIIGPGIGDKPLRIVGRSGNFTANSFFTVDDCADFLSGLLLNDAPGEQRRECRALLKELIGEYGNLYPDPAVTEAERQKAVDAVERVMVSKNRGSLLIRKGERFTPEMREMIDAERAATPRSGWFEAYRQMGWSFVILLAGVLFICFVSKEIRRDNLRILLAGLTVAAALSFNYNMIKLFEYMLRNAMLFDEKLVVAALPVAFCAVVLSIVLDMRTAICAGGIVAVISAMMIMPSRSLELALRWMAISSGVALMMRNVGNYRSFFMRTVGSVLVMTWALNLDLIFYGRPGAEIPKVLQEAVWVILGNAVFCAMTALLMIFVLELLFNLSTDMALMVLSDCNHPVLERLKRKAPGTMAHAMAVATLSEDAARAIGANPVRAKAGALFHDIGKLSNPQYFTENNPNSSLLHDRLKPEESSGIILSHVTDGVELARQYRLCHFIRSVISSHHGDDLVRFFYYKAQEESKKTGAPVNVEDFRYHGKPPRDREEGIISLADACEAASRSIKEPTPEKIGELVGNIIQSRFRDGQLRNSRLTGEELNKLRKSFTFTLSSSMHGRIAYPKEATAAKGNGKC